MLYNIRIKYHPSFINCTEKHPFYVREKERTWNVELKKHEITFKQAEWKKALDLTKNDYFGMKINENNIIPEFSFDKKINQYNTDTIQIKLDNPDMWFMMGYFVGDGWIEETTKPDGRSMNKIRFAINTKDDEYVVRRINNILQITDKKCPSGNKCNKYGCADFVWFNIFKKFGKYAHGKLIPEWVQDAPKEYIEQFIDGYRTADGCINNKECYSFTTVSYNLAFGLQRLYLKLGHLFSVTTFIRPKTTVIEGRTVNQRDTYQVEGYTREKRKQSSFIENGYVWCAPFKLETQSVENEPVYNFEVENDNSYIVENTIAHNCQSFSNSGKKKAFDDDRGLLFDEIMRIAKVKKPRFMFLENVKHILKVSNGEVIEYIKDKIASHGYTLQMFQMSPHNYGVPQQRERVYFVCVRNDIYNNVPIELEPYDSEPLDFTKILENPSEIDDKYKLKGDILHVLEAWDEMIKVFEVGEKLSPTILIHDYYKTYTDEEFVELADWRKDYMTKNKPLIEKYKPQFDAWYNKHRELLNKREIYGKLEWQVGVVKENDSIFNYFSQIRQSGIRVKKAQYFPTLVAISQIPIYGKEKRYITPRECARLQSFPESYIIHKDDKKSYKQFGNSVNVNNVFNVINSTLKHYNL
jgi:DNA (cytosine-5)-methyltransferase 1